MAHEEISLDSMRSLFRLLDEDGGGSLSAEEIKKGMHLLGFKEADDPVQTIVMMVRRPETDDAVVEDKKAQKPADKPSAPAVEVSSETTYISQGQRKELRGIFERGELTFAEFRTILKKNFNTSFDPRTGPGSHSDLIRHRSDGKPVVAQVSPDVRNGREACHLGIIEATLKDLHIKPEEFLTALKKHRNVT